MHPTISTGPPDGPTGNTRTVEFAAARALADLEIVGGLPGLERALDGLGDTRGHVRKGVCERRTNLGGPHRRDALRGAVCAHDAKVAVTEDDRARRRVERRREQAVGRPAGPMCERRRGALPGCRSRAHP